MTATHAPPATSRWTRCTDRPPPRRTLVRTRIDDGLNGPHHEAMLQSVGFSRSWMDADFRPVAYLCSRCGWSGKVNGRPRCLACYALRAAAWRAENPEKAGDLKRRMDKKSRAENPGKEATRKRAKRAKNPEHYKAKYAERMAWLRAGDATREQLRAIYFTADGKCHYCGRVVFGARFGPSDPRGFDHVAPRSKGGKHTATNLVVCCGPCNERRSDHV